jgi:hypothetical protein
VVALFLHATSDAQVNTEKLRLNAFAPGITGETGFEAAISAGNVEFIDIGLRGRVDYEDTLWLAFVTGTFQMRSQSRNVFDRSAFVHGRYNRAVRAGLVVEAFGQLEYNKSLRLKNRSLAGAGVRIPALDLQGFSAIFGTAWMYEYEERSGTGADLDSPISRAHRWSSYIVLRYQGDPGIRFSNTVYIQPHIGAWSDIRVLDEGSLVIVLTKAVSFTNTLSYRFDHEPPSGVKTTDAAYRAGILLSF